MYPELFRLGSLTVTSFGAMVALAALVGLWLFSQELERAGLPASALDAALIGVLGGLAGAKLLYVGEHIGEEPLGALLFARGGLSWYGGMAGGLLAGLVTIAAKGLPAVRVIAAAAPALVIGHAIGRIGCFLVGDDYGRPSDLPWAVAFPLGLPPTNIPVHPTQIYEIVWLVPVAWLLIRMRRRGVPDFRVLGMYLVLTGAGRFVIEFLRVNQRVALGLSIAHWASVAAVTIGAVLAYAPRRDALRNCR